MSGLPAWRSMRARREGICGTCSRPFGVGTRILWEPNTRSVRHYSCPRPDSGLPLKVPGAVTLTRTDYRNFHRPERAP